MRSKTVTWVPPLAGHARISGPGGWMGRKDAAIWCVLRGSPASIRDRIAISRGLAPQDEERLLVPSALDRRTNPPLKREGRKAVAPLCPIGHLPLKGGDRWRRRLGFPFTLEGEGRYGRISRGAPLFRLRRHLPHEGGDWTRRRLGFPFPLLGIGRCGRISRGRPRLPWRSGPLLSLRAFGALKAKSLAFRPLRGLHLTPSRGRLAASASRPDDGGRAASDSVLATGRLGHGVKLPRCDRRR